MVKSAPVTFAVRSLASRTTRSATSSGRENRPVGDWCAAPAATSSGRRSGRGRDGGGDPVIAQPQVGCDGPGLTVLTRTPFGPTSFESAFEKLASAALAAP